VTYSANKTRIVRQRLIIKSVEGGAHDFTVPQRGDQIAFIN
jgi:hypothetical protein